MKAVRRTLSLDKGLRPERNVPTNSNWLLEAKGVLCSAVGLELEPTLVNPFSATVSWPWPQLINTQRKVLLGWETSISEINSSWEETSLGTGLDTGTFWQVADFGTFMYLTNGVELYMWDSSAGTFAATAGTRIPSMGTICNFRGQLVGGNVSGDWYDAGSRYAVWGAIGQETFIPDWKNEAGFWDMGIGTIYLCQDINNQGVIFYGDDGVAMLVPAKQTFGYQWLSHLGLYGACTVGFGEQEHLAILADGTLWSFKAEGAQRLGYKEYLSQLDATLTRICYDPLKQTYYLGDGTTGFAFHNGQLTQVCEIPTSLSIIDGSQVAIFDDATLEVVLQTMWQDYMMPVLKSAEFGEFGLSTDGAATSRIDITYGLGEDVVELDWVRLNPSGFCYYSGTGNKVSFYLKVTGLTSFHLPYMSYGLKFSDNRIQNQLQTMSDRSWDAN